jgi:hypothetical protein
MTALALAQDMLAAKDIAGFPSPDEPALVLNNPDKRPAIDAAYATIAPMYWGPRIPLDEACNTIRAWLGKLHQDRWISAEFRADPAEGACVEQQ